MTVIVVVVLPAFRTRWSDFVLVFDWPPAPGGIKLSNNAAMRRRTSLAIRDASPAGAVALIRPIPAMVYMMAGCRVFAASALRAWSCTWSWMAGNAADGGGRRRTLSGFHVTY